MIYIFRSMTCNSSLNFVSIYSSFLPKPPVSLCISYWPHCFMLGVCFCSYVMIKVYNTSSFILFLRVPTFQNIQFSLQGISQKKETAFTTLQMFEIENTSSCLCEKYHKKFISLYSL